MTLDFRTQRYHRVLQRSQRQELFRGCFQKVNLLLSALIPLAVQHSTVKLRRVTTPATHSTVTILRNFQCCTSGLPTSLPATPAVDSSNCWDHVHEFPHYYCITPLARYCFIASSLHCVPTPGHKYEWVHSAPVSSSVVGV